MSATLKRPILRYHGGKWKLADWLVSLFPRHRTYVEPFGGAASVLLKKPRSYAEVYNDLDGEVVNLFRVARDRGNDLARAVELTPYAREEFYLSFLPDLDPLEQARRTVLRSFAGFGGNLTRQNRDGTRQRTGFRGDCTRSGTTPASDWRNWPQALAAIVERLQGVVIEHADALQVMQKYDQPDTLHYVDPPYVHSTRGYDAGTHRGYTFEMSDDDHRSLAAVLRSLRGMVVLSGYACELYDVELFPDWMRLERKHHADGARDRTEIVWLNPACAVRQAQPQLFEIPKATGGPQR